MIIKPFTYHFVLNPALNVPKMFLFQEVADMALLVLLYRSELKISPDTRKCFLLSWAKTLVEWIHIGLHFNLTNLTNLDIIKQYYQNPQSINQSINL